MGVSRWRTADCQYKVARLFALARGNASLFIQRNPDSVAAEVALAGLSMMRTSVSAALWRSKARLS
jgi:hypothetical protein